jgi:hypothetical protein
MLGPPMLGFKSKFGASGEPGTAKPGCPLSALHAN